MRYGALSLLAVVVLLVAAAVAAPPVGASPQPSPVCGLCGVAFASAADEAGVDATVTHSTATVRVHGNGSATWVVRNELSNGTDRYRSDGAALAATARELETYSWGQPQGLTAVSARLDGDTVVVRARDPDAATRRLGLLVVDYFHDGGLEPWYHVNTDRLTVRGPPGTVVANDPESGRVDGGSVTWTGNTGEYLYDAPDLEGSPYVVFGPDRSALTGLRSGGAVALATWPIVESSLWRFVVPGTVLFGLALGVVVTLLRWRDPSVAPRALAGVLLGGGLLATVVPGTVQGPRWVSGLAVFVVALGALALSPRGRERLGRGDSPAASLAPLVVAAALGTVALRLLFSALGAGVVDRVGVVSVAVEAALVALPAAALVVLGWRLDGHPRRRRAAALLAVGSYVLVPAALVDLANPPSGLGSGVMMLLFIVLAVVVPVLGIPVVLLGRSLARAAPVGGTS